MPAKGHETPEEAEARSALEDTRAFAAARDALLREVEGHYFGQASGFVVAVVKIQRVERGVVGLDGITRHRVVFDAVVLRLIEGSIVDAMVEKVVDDVSVIASNGILTAIVRLPAADMRVVRASMDDPTLYRTPIRFMIDGGELTFHARQKMHCVGSTLPRDADADVIRAIDDDDDDEEDEAPWSVHRENQRSSHLLGLTKLF